MFTVRKTVDPAAQDRHPIQPSQRRALMRVWEGTATAADEILVRSLIEATHEQDRWIACDCLAPQDGPQPLMAPAFLRLHQTHYLRRLYGKTRALHDQACPFYGEPALGFDKILEVSQTDRPDGYFAVPDHAAAPPKDLSALGLPKPDAAPRRGDNLLRRQLWRLMERARLTVIAPPVRGRQPSYKFEYAALKDAAEELHVAYGVPLSRVFETVPTAFERKSIYAKIRQAARQRRDDVDGCRGDPLQGWACFFARDADPDEVRATLGGRTVSVRPARGVDVLPGGAPYLVLVCVSADEKGDLRPVRAVAQPVLGMRRFFPIYRAEERETVEALISAQYAIARRERDLALGFDRTLFGLPGDTEPGRLSCLVTDLRRGVLHERSATVADLADTDPAEIARHVLDWALSRKGLAAAEDSTTGLVPAAG